MSLASFTRRAFSTARPLFQQSPAVISPHLKEFIDKRMNNTCFDNVFTRKWKVVSAPEDQGKFVVELKVDEQLANAGKILHGGLIASLVDGVSTIALVNTQLRKSGVSLNINVTYIKAVRINESILVEGRVVKCGSKIAFLEADLYLKDKSGSNELKKENLVATGSHTKYIG